MVSEVSPDLLSATGVSKAFPGVQALIGVDFTLRPGEIHALMGENGAGKSTLIKVLTGVYQPDGGSVLLDGKPIQPQGPREAQSIGISTVFQEVNLVPTLSVAENICLGRLPTRAGRIQWKQVHTRAKAALARLNIDVDPAENVGSCSIAIQQLVAIARALDVESKVLILDEPTSSLDAAEVEQLFAILRKLRKEGLGIVFVSHFLDQIYAISDRITVLRNGLLVGSYETAQLPHLSLVAKMLGREEAEVEKLQHTTPIEGTRGEAILAAQNLGRKGSVSGVDLAVAKGEVVGLAGLLGSGRTETARLLFGLDRADRGTLSLAGKDANLKSPRQAIRHGLGLVPEDRKVEAIFPSLSVRENIVLALQAKQGWLRRLSTAAQNELAQRYIQGLRIATPSSETPVGQLSGGNQQKVVLARWLALQPQVLILDEPTRGVDVGAKAEIEAEMRRLCADGLAVVLIASEIEDVTRESNRLVVFRDRTMVGELVGEAIRVDEVMKLVAAGENP